VDGQNEIEKSVDSRLKPTSAVIGGSLDAFDTVETTREGLKRTRNKFAGADSSVIKLPPASLAERVDAATLTNDEKPEVAVPVTEEDVEAAKEKAALCRLADFDRWVGLSREARVSEGHIPRMVRQAKGSNTRHPQEQGKVPKDIDRRTANIV
jgi:hypothetical protein